MSKQRIDVPQNSLGGKMCRVSNRSPVIHRVQDKSARNQKSGKYPYEGLLQPNRPRVVIVVSVVVEVTAVEVAAVNIVDVAVVAVVVGTSSQVLLSKEQCPSVHLHWVISQYAGPCRCMKQPNPKHVPTIACGSQYIDAWRSQSCLCSASPRALEG